MIIDYLQILSPYNERYTDKQNMDKAVLELKRISRDHKIPVIAISSFNRSAYKKEAEDEAYKEEIFQAEKGMLELKKPNVWNTNIAGNMEVETEVEFEKFLVL